MLTRKSAAQRLSRPSVTFFGFTKKSASEREQLAPRETHAETVASPDDYSSARNDTALHAFSAAAAPEYPDREPRPEVLEHTSETPNAPAHESRTNADQTDTQPPRSAQALPNHAAPSSKAVAQSAALMLCPSLLYMPAFCFILYICMYVQPIWIFRENICVGGVVLLY